MKPEKSQLIQLQQELKGKQQFFQICEKSNKVITLADEALADDSKSDKKENYLRNFTMITDGIIDRGFYNLQFKIDGLNATPLKHFFMDHNTSVLSAIGSIDSSQIKTQKKKLSATVKFDSSDENAMKVMSKYDSGILSGVSIGVNFDEAEVQYEDAKGNDLDKPFVIVYKATILELSAVGVPADKNATANFSETKSNIDEMLSEIDSKEKDFAKNKKDDNIEKINNLQNLGVNL